VYEDEEESQANGCAYGVGVCYSPGYTGQEHEEGKEVGEGRVGAVPGVLGLCGRCQDYAATNDGRVEAYVSGGVLAFGFSQPGREVTYMVVYRLEDFLRRYQKACHLPYCHLEVHLWELEQSICRHKASAMRTLDG